MSKEAAEVCGCPSLTNWFENSFQLLFVLALLTWLWQKKEEGRRKTEKEKEKKKKKKKKKKAEEGRKK